MFSLLTKDIWYMYDYAVSADRIILQIEIFQSLTIL